MKSLPPTFRMNRVDKEILEMMKEGIEIKRVVRKTKLPYRVASKKIDKLKRLGLA